MPHHRKLWIDVCKHKKLDVSITIAVVDSNAVLNAWAMTIKYS
jgi:hypothetical protein